MISDTIPAPMESPLIFYSSPRSLQEMASSQCALLCWNLTYTLHYNLYPDETADAYWFVSCKNISSGDIFHLPKSIRELIDLHMESIGPMLYRWAQNSFGGNCRDNVLKCFDDIELQSNGEICYKTTAKNMLSCDKLNPVENYKIACWCGFEEQINCLWPLVRDDARIRECDFHRQPTMFYWNCRMNNELHRIPGDERDSPEWRMILSNELNFWSEMEYFWNKLSPREQILQIIKVPEGLELISKYLMPKLSQSQLGQILRYIPSAMVVNLAIERETADYAWQTWNFIKSSISDKEFYEILHLLWNFAFDGSSTNVSHVADFLYEVWISATDNLRRHVLANWAEFFFDSLDSDRVIESYGCDMSFLLDVFANSTIELRKEIWLCHWCKLIMLAKPSDLQKFMDLCFGDRDCIVKFKQTLMIDYVMLHCEFSSFVRRGLCDEFVEYLKFCTPNERLVRRIRVKIIKSNMKKMFYSFDFKAFVKFNQFIDGSFRNPGIAKQFKEKFVLENVNIWYDMLEKGWLTEAQNTIDCLSSSQHIRRLLFEHWQRILESGSFTRFYLREWKEFLEWCRTSEKEIVMLKESLNVDDILSKVLSDCIRAAVISPPCFSPLDSFLRWYFVTEDATKRYKLSRIINHHDDDVVGHVLRGGNNEYIRRLLLWFFDYDLVAAERFRARIGN